VIVGLPTSRRESVIVTIKRKRKLVWSESWKLIYRMYDIGRWRNRILRRRREYLREHLRKCDRDDTLDLPFVNLHCCEEP